MWKQIVTKRISLIFFLSLLLVGCSRRDTSVLVEDETKSEEESSQEQGTKLKEADESGYISPIDIIKMSEDERQELFEEYSPRTGMILRSEEDRIQNPYFFPAGQEKMDMTVRYDNLEFLMLNGDANDPLYDEKKYIRENVCFNHEYLFSYKSGDVYVIWYPDLYVPETMDSEGSTEEVIRPDMVGVFYVTEKEIIDVRYLAVDDEPVAIYVLNEENMLSPEYGFPVCVPDSRESIETNLSWDVNWRIVVYQDNDYVVADIKTEDDFYERYVWKEDAGLVGYQYGKYVGGDQHDFFTEEYILENFLYRGWE